MYVEKSEIKKNKFLNAMQMNKFNWLQKWIEMRMRVRKRKLQYIVQYRLSNWNTQRDQASHIPPIYVALYWFN